MDWLEMDWVELIGYAGTTLTVVAYAMKSSVRLRIAGIMSSLAFLTYGALTQSYPVMLMEMLLLPLNLWRLWQMLRLMRSATPTIDQGQGRLDWLLPHMLRVHLKPGCHLFTCGDQANRLMVIVSGTVNWRGEQFGPGAVIGDADLFDHHRRQNGSAYAETAIEIAITPKSRLAEIYFENPAFGRRLVQLLLEGMNRELDLMRGRRLFQTEAI